MCAKLSSANSSAKIFFLLCWEPAIIAQSVERRHGKAEVNSSILFDGSNSAVILSESL